MDRETARQEIRSQIRCAEYLTKSKSGLYNCPFCGSGTGVHGTGAVKYYSNTNTWYCHACRKGGDVIDLHQNQTGEDFNAALSSLARKIGITIDSYRPTAAEDFAHQKNESVAGTATDEPADYTPYYMECLERIKDQAAAEYLNRRGISLDTAVAYWIGYDPAADPANAPGAESETDKPHPCPRIIIPTSTGHYIGRSIDPKTEKAFAKLNPAGSTPAIFNENVLYKQEVQEVFVTEGAFDALSVIEAGAAAIALNSAANADALIKKLEQRKTSATLILCLDNDERGQKAEETIIEGLRRLNIGYVKGDICAQYKDPNEYLTGDREAFIKAVHEARRQASCVIGHAQQAERERQQRTGESMVDDFLENVQTTRYEPVPTGITDIDNAIGGGFLREQIILLGAAPGAGKTALAQWMFEGMAKRKQTCIYLNLEMSRDQMLARSLARIAAENGHRIKATDILQGYKWDRTQKDIVKEAAQRYKKEIAAHMIYNPDGVAAELDSILSYIEAEAARAEAANLPVPCVVLDYLQIVRGREREDDTSVIKRAMESLKAFAIKHKTFVFVIIAHNRGSNRSGDVTQEAGRDTSALEYGADLQLGLAYTLCMKKYGGKAKEDLTPEEMKRVTLKVTKGRWGRPGAEANLSFDGETMTYTQEDNAHDEPILKAGRKPERKQKGSWQ